MPCLRVSAGRKRRGKVCFFNFLATEGTESAGRLGGIGFNSKPSVAKCISIKA